MGPQRPGGAELSRRWTCCRTLTRKAVDYIADHAAGAKQGKPFFLYLPLASPHTPILPTKEWQGKSGLNPYADFVMQTDATVGAVLDALEQQGLAENTLVIFTSDNGCSARGRFPELAGEGAQSQLPLSRHQGGYFRWRPPDSVSRPLAGAGEGGHDQRPTDLPDGFVRHLRGYSGQETSG